MNASVFIETLVNTINGDQGSIGVLNEMFQNAPADLLNYSCATILTTEDPRIHIHALSYLSRLLTPSILRTPDELKELFNGLGENRTAVINAVINSLQSTFNETVNIAANTICHICRLFDTEERLSLLQNLDTLFAEAQTLEIKSAILKTYKEIFSAKFLNIFKKEFKTHAQTALQNSLGMLQIESTDEQTSRMKTPASDYIRVMLKVSPRIIETDIRELFYETFLANFATCQSDELFFSLSKTIVRYSIFIQSSDIPALYEAMRENFNIEQRQNAFLQCWASIYEIRCNSSIPLVESDPFLLIASEISPVLLEGVSMAGSIDLDDMENSLQYNCLLLIEVIAEKTGPHFFSDLSEFITNNFSMENAEELAAALFTFPAILYIDTEESAEFIINSFDNILSLVQFEDETLRSFAVTAVSSVMKSKFMVKEKIPETLQFCLQNLGNEHGGVVKSLLSIASSIFETFDHEQTTNFIGDYFPQIFDSIVSCLSHKSLQDLESKSQIYKTLALAIRGLPALCDENVVTQYFAVIVQEFNKADMPIKELLSELLVAFKNKMYVIPGYTQTVMGLLYACLEAGAGAAGENIIDGIETLLYDSANCAQFFEGLYNFLPQFIMTEGSSNTKAIYCLGSLFRYGEGIVPDAAVEQTANSVLSMLNQFAFGEDGTVALLSTLSDVLRRIPAGVTPQFVQDSATMVDKYNDIVRLCLTTKKKSFVTRMFIFLIMNYKVLAGIYNNVEAVMHFYTKIKDDLVELDKLLGISGMKIIDYNKLSDYERRKQEDNAIFYLFKVVVSALDAFIDWISMNDWNTLGPQGNALKREAKTLCSHCSFGNILWAAMRNPDSNQASYASQVYYKRQAI